MKMKLCVISTIVILFATFSNFAIAQNAMKGTEKQLSEHVKQVLPDQKYRLKISFVSSHSISKIEQFLLNCPLDLESLNYTWGDHNGWYFLKEGQTPKDAMLDFQNKLKVFIESMIEKHCPSTNKNTDKSDDQKEIYMLNTLLFIEEFENQLDDFNKKGLMLSGISLTGKGNELSQYVSSKSEFQTLKYHYELGEITTQEPNMIQSEHSKEIDSEKDVPYNDPWKFSPSSGSLEYNIDNVNNRYFLSEFQWTDTSGFDSIHRGYEHDIIIWGPRNKYVKANRQGMFSNLPSNYIDSEFRDKENHFALGSASATDLKIQTTYYTHIPVDVIDANGGPTTGDIQAQLSSWAGDYEDGDDTAEWEERLFCNVYPIPANCFFADQIHTIGNDPRAHGTMYYNSSGAYLNFPFDHRSPVTYYWDKNYDPNQYCCPVGQFRGEYINPETGNALFIRCDPKIDFDWGKGGPFIGLERNDKFKIEWSGRFNFESGNYIFIARADDGIRVWLDGEMLIDAWQNQPVSEFSANKSVKKGEHSIKVEYFEDTGDAVVQFRWEKKNETKKPLVHLFDINNGAPITTNRIVTLNNSCSGNPTHYMTCSTSDFSGASWLNYSSAPTFELSPGNGKKLVYFKVKNGIKISSVKRDTIKLDQNTVPAINSFTINNGSPSTMSRTVTLNNSCSGSPTYYMASEAIDFFGASWLTYSSAPSFTLSSGNGSKTVYFRVKNNIGSSTMKYDTITLNQDTVPTVNSFSINNGASSTNSRTVTLNNSCSGSPTSYMASESSDFSGASWLTYSSAPSFMLSSGNETKTVYFKVKNSTATSLTVSDTIILNIGITYITNPSQGVYTTGGNVLKMKVSITGTKITFTVAKQDNSAFSSSGVMTIRAGAYNGCVANYDKFYWNYYAGQTTTSATFDLYFTFGTKEFYAAVGRPDVYCDGTPPMYYSGKLTVTAQ